jgi:hypothetical protein
MGFSIKQNTKVAVTKETTAGTYEAPADADFIAVQADGLELNGTKDALERNILGTGLTKAQPRTANRSVSGTIPCEFKSGSTEGSEPEYGVMAESALGATRTSGTNVTSETANTSTQLNIGDADISKFKVGDTALVQEAGAFHLSPITVVDESLGAAFITLLVAGAGAFSDNVVVANFTTYVAADTGHPTFSVTKYVEDNIKTEGVGCRTASMAIENFVANQLASWSFGIEGLDFTTAVSAITNTPSYDSSLPPIIVEACIFKNGVKLPVGEMSFSVENTIANITSTCAPSGKLGSRVSDRVITGTLVPYVEDDNVDIQAEFDNDSLYSIFGYAYNPTSTTGEFNQVISFYMPNCSTTELTEADADGILTHNISFSASGGQDGSATPIFITFI